MTPNLTPGVKGFTIPRCQNDTRFLSGDSGATQLPNQLRRGNHLRPILSSSLLFANQRNPTKTSRLRPTKTGNGARRFGARFTTSGRWKTGKPRSIYTKNNGTLCSAAGSRNGRTEPRWASCLTAFSTARPCLSNPGS